MRARILPVLAFLLCLPVSFAAFSSTDNPQIDNVAADLAPDQAISATDQNDLNLEEGATDEWWGRWGGWGGWGRGGGWGGWGGWGRGWWGGGWSWPYYSYGYYGWPYYGGYYGWY